MSNNNNSHFVHAKSDVSYVTSTSSPFVTVTAESNAIPVHLGELKDPRYTTTYKTDTKFATADCGPEDVRCERIPPPYVDGSQVNPNFLQRLPGAIADASADDLGAPFITRAKGPAIGIGEQ